MTSINIFVFAATAALMVPAGTRAHDTPVRETVTVVADEPIPNAPGKRLVSLIVDYPPGASSAPQTRSLGFHLRLRALR